MLQVVEDSPEVLVENSRDDGLDLTDLERRFVEEYFSGEHAQNGTRSFMIANPNANYNTASIEAGRILKKPRVQRYLAQLHRQATETVVGELVPWAQLLPAAQAVILATVQGRLRNRLAFEAACYLTNRVLGLPAATVDLNVANRERIAAATKNFASRMLVLTRAEAKEA